MLNYDASAFAWMEEWLGTLDSYLALFDEDGKAPDLFKKPTSKPVARLASAFKRVGRRMRSGWRRIFVSSFVALGSFVRILVAVHHDVIGRQKGGADARTGLVRRASTAGHYSAGRRITSASRNGITPLTGP